MVISAAIYSVVLAVAVAVAGSVFSIPVDVVNRVVPELIRYGLPSERGPSGLPGRPSADRTLAARRTPPHPG